MSRFWLRNLISAIAALLFAGAAGAQLQDFVPVTESRLEHPEPADWLSWRRTLDSWGYSPLNQINRQNANQLQLVWSWPLSPGISETTALVANGILFVVNPPAKDGSGGVEALDGASGELLWDYRKPLAVEPEFGGRMRSLAIFDDKIFFNSPDAHIVALNARTGAVVWDRVVADSKLGYRYTSGPLIVRGKVVAGMTGCDHFKISGMQDVCFITAHDPQTGDELWRTSTIARPGEPGGDTWGNLPLIYRAGGDAWIPGSFDPVTNLIYWSVAQAKPWARISRGTDGDALYTSSVLALAPETGKIKWYNQLLPGETHDMDEVFENILIDHDGRHSLYKMGKLGILWEIDRVTGKFVAAHDLGYQNIVDVDPETGKVKYRAGMIPVPNVEIEQCPNFGGVKNWRAMAYSPETHAFYVPINLSCQKGMFTEVTPTEGGGGNSVVPFAGERTISSFRNKLDPEHAGGFVAMDMNTGKVLWKNMLAVGTTSSALTTRGGLAIVGAANRFLYIYDAATGKLLFQARLPGAVDGSPITYAVGGKQYLAVFSGNQTSGNAMYVFAVPDPLTGSHSSQ